MNRKNKRTVAIATVLGILVSLCGYFGYNYYSDYSIKIVATKYLTSSDVCTSIENLDTTLKQISTADFYKKNMSNINTSFDVSKKINAKVDKIILLNKTKSALEAEVFYTSNPSNMDYSVPCQLNLVLYKESTGWKVQVAYFMDRSDQPIPANNEVEHDNHIKRFVQFSAVVNKFMQSRLDNDFEMYSNLFSEEADKDTYNRLFKEEQQYLVENKLKLSLISNGLLVNSSTDTEALTTVLLTQSTEKESKSMPQKLKFIYENGEWKISNIFS